MFGANAQALRYNLNFEGKFDCKFFNQLVNKL